MKTKTSLTLSSDLVAKIDRLAGAGRSRSAFVERVLRRYLADRSRAALNARDRERINRAAEEINAEAADILRYQASED